MSGGVHDACVHVLRERGEDNRLGIQWEQSVQMKSPQFGKCKIILVYMYSLGLFVIT